MNAADRTDNCPQCHTSNNPVCWEPTLTNLAGGRFTYECRCGNEWVTHWAGDFFNDREDTDTATHWGDLQKQALAEIDARRQRFIAEHSVDGVLDINAGEGP